MSSPFIGEIQMFAGNYAPQGFAFCNGAIIPVAQNGTLSSLLGPTYGGNGVTNFGLPNLQGAAPMGSGTGPNLTPRSRGATGGEATVALTTAMTPAHTHDLQATSSAGESTTPAGNLPAEVRKQRYGIDLYASTPGTAPATGATLLAVGGGAAHNNLPPYLVVTFIIALMGVFPSTSSS
jgi:microcystin-dependent protein